jgi:hypothetical protein
MMREAAANFSTTAPKITLGGLVHPCMNRENKGNSRDTTWHLQISLVENILAG